MLAFLGAIICIIASVHPAFRGGGGAAHGPDNDSNALMPPEKELGSLHRAETLYGGRAGHKSATLDLSGAKPLAPQFYSRMVCTPLALECPSDTPQDAPAGGHSREDVLFLQATAEQLRQTVLQQKGQIATDQEAIRELTGKLSRCENGLERSFHDSAAAHAWASGKDTMGDLPHDSSDVVHDLEESVRTLKDRTEKIEQEIQQRLRNATSASTTGTPLLGRDSLHARLEELEGQLLAKLLELEKDRPAASAHDDKQRVDVEKELSALQSRIAELEHGTPTFTHPDAFKVAFSVRTNYMYARMKKTLPEMYAFTFCLWLKSKGSSGAGTPFSYSVPGQPNEIVLIEWGPNPMELIINDKATQLPVTLKDNAWHHVCISWTTRDGMWAAFQDGVKRGSRENLAAWHPIKPNGIIILGQEQDNLGGRFDATQAFVGEIAQFNFWDRVLSHAEIQGLANCTGHQSGNAIQWEDKAVETFGGAAKVVLESCEERIKP
ncbi:neuronal pentraxin receptor [Lissotriton helveticus]